MGGRHSHRQCGLPLLVTIQCSNWIPSRSPSLGTQPKASRPCVAPLHDTKSQGLGVSVCKCDLLLHSWLGGAASPPGPPLWLTTTSPSKTRRPSCFSRSRQATGVTAAGDALAFCRCRPFSLPRVSRGARAAWRVGSGSAPAWSQSRPKTCFGKLRPLSGVSLRQLRDWGPARICSATWALGAGSAPACPSAGAARVWAGAGASAGGASALRHPGFLTSPPPSPVSSFAWPAMAAILRRSKGK